MGCGAGASKRMGKASSKFDLNEHEHALCMASVKLNVAHQSAVQATYQNYLVVGTGYVYPEGEERAGNGRLLVFEIRHRGRASEDIEVVSGQPQTVPELHLRCQESLFGPICAITCINGMIVLSLGSIPASIKMYRLEGASARLSVRGFIDTQSSAICLKVVKDFLLVGDLNNGAQFVRWSEKQKKFALLAKDKEATRVLTTEYIIDGGKLGLVVGDENGGLRMLQYAPKSKTPQRLVCYADFNVGSRVGAMVSRKLEPVGRGENKAGFRTSVLMGFLDGGLGTVMPISEQTHRIFSLLQEKLIEKLHFNCGLNHRAYRTFTHRLPMLRPAKPSVIDCAIIEAFVDELTYAEQREVARSCGTTPDTIADRLLQIQMQCNWS